MTEGDRYFYQPIIDLLPHFQKFWPTLIERTSNALRANLEGWGVINRPDISVDNSHIAEKYLSWIFQLYFDPDLSRRTLAQHMRSLLKGSNPEISLGAILDLLFLIDRGGVINFSDGVACLVWVLRQLEDSSNPRVLSVFHDLGFNIAAALNLRDPKRPQKDGFLFIPRHELIPLLNSLNQSLTPTEK